MKTTDILTMRRTRTDSDRKSLLARTELLGSMPEELLSHIERDLRSVRAEKGDMIFRDGETGDAVYFIAEGTVAIRKNGIDLVTRSTGECVGEFALLDDGPRSASAIAETDLVLLRWDRRDFQRTLSIQPRGRGPYSQDSDAQTPAGRLTSARGHDSAGELAARSGARPGDQKGDAPP